MNLRWIRATLLVQILVFGGWIGLEERNRIAVAVVMLETAPVDPRDLWAGKYLTLAYRISAIDRLPGFPHDRPATPMPVAVRLAPAQVKARDGSPRTIWQAVEVVSGDLPAARKTGDVWVTGRWSGPGRGADYGIGRYYFSEGRMDEIRGLTAGRFLVECAVSKDGRLTIRRLVE